MEYKHKFSKFFDLFFMPISIIVVLLSFITLIVYIFALLPRITMDDVFILIYIDAFFVLVWIVLRVSLHLYILKVIGEEKKRIRDE